MGNYVNKLFSHDNEIEKEETEVQSSTDEVTVENDIMYCTPPVCHKTLPIDPRSVTSGIDRTPIEVNSTPVRLQNKRMISAIPKHLQARSYLETDIDKIMPCLTPKKRVPRMTDSAKLQFLDVQNKNIEVQLTPKVNLNGERVITSIEKERYDILGLDPRSPAADFDRTPILMPKSIERLRARSQECLNRRGSYETDVFYSRFSYCEMSSQFTVPEIQALPDLAACTIKSLNLLNAGCNDRLNESDSSCSSQSSKTEANSEIGEKQLESEDEYETTSEQNSHNDLCTKKDEPYKEIHINDTDTIKVWRDSLVLDELGESKLIESDNAQVIQKKIQLPKEEVIITFDDDNIIKDTLSSKMFKSDNEKKKIEITGKKKALKSEIKIAADERKTFNSNDKNGNESTKIRTPLGNRSNNGQMQTLSTKSPQQIFRNKSIMPKILQENTPPHKRYVPRSKLNSIQWDPDSTVII